MKRTTFYKAQEMLDNIDTLEPLNTGSDLEVRSIHINIVAFTPNQEVTRVVLNLTQKDLCNEIIELLRSRQKSLQEEFEKL